MITISLYNDACCNYIDNDQGMHQQQSFEEVLLYLIFATDNCIHY